MGRLVHFRWAATSAMILICTGCSPKILSGVSAPSQSGVNSSGVSQSLMIANPVILQADGSSSSKVTVTLEDENGIPVVGKSVSLFSSRGSLDSILLPSSISDRNGKVSFLVRSTHAGTSVLTATDVTDRLSISSSANLLFLPGNVIPSETTLVSSQTTVIADGIANSQITVTLRDAQGNPVAGKSVTLSSSRGGDVIVPSAGLTGSSGSFSFFVSSTTSGSSVFTAMDVNDNLVFPEITQVIFKPGVGASLQSTLVASSGTVVANGISTSTIMVTLRDAQGNFVPGKTVTLTSNRGSIDTISSASGASNSSGVVTFNVQSATGGSSTFIAFDSTDSVTVNQTATITFVANLVSASQSTVSSSPSSILANGSLTSAISVTLKDSAGNPVSGKSVTLSSSRGPSDTISPASGPSSVSGTVSFTVTSIHAGSSIFTATDLTDTLSVTQTASVNFTPDSVSSSQSTLSASPASVAADGSTPSTITVTLLDANSNPVAGKSVSLSSSRGAADTISAASGLSNSSGQITFTVLSSTIGTSTLTATDTTDSVTITQVGTLTFVAGATSPGTSTITASPTLVSGNGSDPSTITVTLLDSHSHPISGKTVSLSSSRGGSDALSTSNSTSDSNGKVVFTLLSSTVGDAILTAQNTDDSATLTQTATVHFYGNLSTSSRVSATPASVPADYSSLSTITVTLLDSTSTPIPGKTITLSSSRGALDTITTTNGTTNTSGQATFTLKSNQIGMPVVTATDNSDSVPIGQAFRIHMIASGSALQTDYRADLANQGYLPGNNTLPVSSFRNAVASSNNGTLFNFGYSTSSGWSGDGGLITSGALGPNRLVFNGSSNYLDLGSSINSNSSFSFESWIRPLTPAANGSVILSTADPSNKGFNLSQLSDGSGRVVLAPAGVTSVYSEAVISDSPLIYWKLDEASGTSAADSSGTGNTGTYGGAPGSITFGLPGLISGSQNSVNLSGSNYIYSNTSFANPPYFTVEGWFSTTGSGTLIEFSGSQGSTPDNCDRIVFVDSYGNLNFYLYYNANYVIISTSNYAYNDGRRHHFAASVSSAGQSLYVDGTLMNSGIASGQQGYSGYWQAGYSSIFNNYYSGVLDEVAVYGTALSAARIQAHYLAGTENCISRIPLSSNDWSHLAGVFSNSNNTASLYLNGNQQCTIPLQGINYSGSASSLTVGSTPSQTNFWSGAIASIKNYSQALTTSLVQQNYATTAAQFDTKQLGAPAPIMWLKADHISGLSDGAILSSWPDSSANGYSVVQGTVGVQPIWKKNVLNGYPVVRFNSTYLDGPSVFPTNSDYSITVALTNSQNAHGYGDQIILGYSDVGPGHLFATQEGSFGATNNGVRTYASTGIGLNSPVILSLTYQYGASTINFYLNGAPSGSSSIDSNPNATVRFGATYGHYPFIGDIAEIFLFGSALSDNDRSLVETYLNAKYGIY